MHFRFVMKTVMHRLYQMTVLIVTEIWRAMCPHHNHPECHPGDVEVNGLIAQQDSALAVFMVEWMAHPVRLAAGRSIL